VDLLRSRVEDYVDAVRCDRTLSSEDVAVAAKLPALNDPLGDRVGQLRLGVVKHGLQGKLQGHSTFEVVSAKYRVVDLDRAVYRADQHCQPPSHCHWGSCAWDFFGYVWKPGPHQHTPAGSCIGHSATVCVCRSAQATVVVCGDLVLALGALLTGVGLLPLQSGVVPTYIDGISGSYYSTQCNAYKLASQKATANALLMNGLSANLAFYQSFDLASSESCQENDGHSAGSKQARADDDDGVTVEAVIRVDDHGDVASLGCVCIRATMYDVSGDLITS